MTDNTAEPTPTDTVAAIFVRHPLWEDALALLFGTALVALGIAFYAHAGLLTGGTVGIAFLANYQAGWSFGLVFCLVNLPFYLLGIWCMGWGFTLRTGCAVLLVSLLAELTPQWVAFAHLSAVYAALFGGAAMGLGLLMLFRHRASLGGLNVLVLWLQERFGWRAGHVQMAIDSVILLASWPWIDAPRLALSVLAAAAMNFALAINHRPGRYMAF